MANHDREGWAEKQKADGLPESDDPTKGGPECSHLQHDASELLWLQCNEAWLSGEVMY